MRSAISIFLLFLAVFLSGCGEKPAPIEGKVIDAKGQPMSGVTVIAKPVEPARAGQQAETTTGPDGIFRFNGLLPASEYSVFPSPDKWKASPALTVRSGQEGQKSVLPSAITVRFIVSKDGIIRDSQSGLQWAPAKDRVANWFQAQSYAQNLSLDGKGWRLPDKSELAGIYESIKGGMGPVFNIHNNWVWTIEIEDDKAWAFNFSYGGNDKLPRGRADSRFRALAVRSPSDAERTRKP